MNPIRYGKDLDKSLERVKNKLGLIVTFTLLDEDWSFEEAHFFVKDWEEVIV